jgi:hypothetical protein
MLYEIKYTVNEDFFNELGKEQAWFLGMMSADGHVRNGRQVCISQSGESGEKVINYIKKLINFNGNIHYHDRSKQEWQDSYHIVFTSKNYFNKLNYYSICPNKTYNQEFPLNLPDNLLSAYLIGKFEGDGCAGVYTNKNGYSYLQMSFVGTKNFIEECSKRIPIPYSSVREHSCSNVVWQITWNGKKAINFYNWLWEGNENLYKSKKYFIPKNYIETHVFEKDKYIEIRKQVQALLDINKSVLTISKELDIPFQSIYKWIKNNKLYVRNTKIS